MIRGFFEGLNERGVSPVIAIVLLLMMTVAAAGAAYFWITSMQSSVQQSAGSQIEAITKQASTRIIAQATLCKPPAEDDLVGYWKFDKGKGTTAEDSIGGNDGTINGASWANYGERYALEFDGVDDYVDAGNDNSLNFGSDESFTVMTWLKASPTSTPSTCLWKRHGWQEGYNLDSANARFIIEDNSGNVQEASYNEDLRDGNWHFLVGGVNRKTDKMFVSVDGREKVTSDISNIGNTNSGTTLKIGRRDTATVHYFNGTIDEVRIYDKALTGEAAKAAERVDVTVYNAGVEAVPEGTWVANLIKNGNTIESDTYNASRLDPEERVTLNFYFSKLHPGGEYTIELEGTETSTTVSC